MNATCRRCHRARGHHEAITHQCPSAELVAALDGATPNLIPDDAARFLDTKWADSGLPFTIHLVPPPEVEPCTICGDPRREGLTFCMTCSQLTIDERQRRRMAILDGTVPDSKPATCSGCATPLHGRRAPPALVCLNTECEEYEHEIPDDTEPDSEPMTS